MAFFGEIRAFTGSIPAGWLPCDGRLLKIRQHEVLHFLIGTTYGGDGKDTFALPDLRDRATAGADQRSEQPVGTTSGLSGEDAKLIPFAVLRWGIASSQGEFPLRRTKPT